MKKKLLSLLSGLSMILLTGLLSIIPADVCRAVPPSGYTVNENDLVYFVADIYTGTMPAYPSGECSSNWTYYGVDTSANPIRTRLFAFIMSQDGSQAIYATTIFSGTIDNDAYATLSFNLVCNGIPYSGSVNIPYTNRNSLLLTIDDSIIAFPVNTGFPLKEFYDSIDKKADEINLALQGLNPDGSENPEKTVKYVFNGAISEKIIRALAASDGVTLIYTFEYEGYTFRSTITSEMAKEFFSPDIAWYGPCYIASNCPTEYVAEAG